MCVQLAVLQTCAHIFDNPYSCYLRLSKIAKLLCCVEVRAITDEGYQWSFIHKENV